VDTLGLNPQPLPPGPPPEKFSGKAQFETKLQTEVLHVDKEKLKLQNEGLSPTSSGSSSGMRHRGKH
jgi:hypothetical protein